MKVSLDEKIRKACAWIRLAETNFFVCKRIQEWKEAENFQQLPDFLTLASNNAFFTAVETIHALVASGNRSDLRLEPLLKELLGEGNFEPTTVGLVEKYEAALETLYPDLDQVNPLYIFNLTDPTKTGDVLEMVKREKLVKTGLNELAEIKADLKTKRFVEIRHQTVAHKNPEVLHPDGSIRYLLHSDCIEQLEPIIKRLRIQSGFWFNRSPGNPDLRQVLSQLDVILQSQPVKTHRP